MEEFLKQLLTTLNQLEVKGKTNLDYLLGAIVAIESAIEQLKPTEETEEITDG